MLTIEEKKREYKNSHPLVMEHLNKSRAALRDFNRCFPCKFFQIAKEDIDPTRAPYAVRTCIDPKIDKKTKECYSRSLRVIYRGLTIPDSEESNA